jgi:hypothetical protein
MDEVLHAERVGPGGAKVTFRARLTDIPSGTLVRYAAGERSPRACLVMGSRLLPWGHAGYAALSPGAAISEEVEVLTPRSIVAVLAAGYRPMLHPSATALLGSGSNREARAP